MIPLWVFQLIVPAAVSCLTVPHDRILAEDLAKMEPQFSLLAPGLAMAFAPMPGTQRVLPRRELLTLLRQNGVQPSGPVGDLCVERKTAELSEPELVAAIQEAINIGGLHIQIMDYSRQQMPPGIIQLKIGSIVPRAPARPELPVIWPGRSVYEGGSSSIWVKAVLWVEHKAVVASVDLAAGRPIPLKNLRLDDVRESPLGGRSATSIDQVVGLKSRTLIRRDTPISLSQLEVPWTILKGEKVLVRVLAGSTHITLEAVALSSGRSGDEVTLRNPESHQIFRAVVEAKGAAIVSLRGSP